MDLVEIKESPYFTDSTAFSHVLFGLLLKERPLQFPWTRPLLTNSTHSSHPVDINLFRDVVVTLPSFLIHCIPYPRRLEGSMVGDGRGHPEARATWQVYLQLGLRPQVPGPSASAAWSNQRVEPQAIIPRLAPGTQTKNGPHFLSSGVMISKSWCNF